MNYFSVFFLLLFSFNVYAFPKVSLYYYSDVQPSVRGPTPSSVFESIGGSKYTVYRSDLSICSGGMVSRFIDSNGYVHNIIEVCGCPENSSPSLVGCSCNSGFEFLNNSCVPPCPSGTTRNQTTGQCEADCSAYAGNVYTVGSDSFASAEDYCLFNCKVAFVQSEPCIYSTNSDGNVSLMREGYCNTYRVTGESGCSGSQMPSPVQPEQECAGKCTGTVNGKLTCVPCGPDQPYKGSATGDSKTTNADGSSTEKQVKVEVQTVNGVTTKTTTTTTTTKAPDGSVIDQQTSVQTETFGSSSGNPATDPNAGPGGNGDGAGSKFCDDYPDSYICQKRNFGGNCMASFECSGDQIDCAVAKEIHRRNCQLFEEDNDYKRLGEPGLTVDPSFQSKMDQALNSNGSNDIDIFQAFQNHRQEYVSIASSCPFPSSITVGHTTVSLPRDDMCSIGSMIRVMMIAFGYLFGLGVLVRGIT